MCQEAIEFIELSQCGTKKKFNYVGNVFQCQVPLELPNLDSQ